MTGRYVGARVMRVEDPRFLAGRATYLDDIEPRGALHVAFHRSPYAHARIASVDTSKARALEGVALVLTGEDLRDLPPFTTTIGTRPETKIGTRHMLPLDRVRFVGEAVAVVAASSRYVAEDAAELIDVEYEPLPVVLDPEAALGPGAPVLHEEIGDNNFAHIEFEAGDVEAAFTGAAHVFRKRFHFGRCHAAPLEGRGVIADWDASENSVTVWTSTQMPFLVRGMLAAQFGLPDTRVRVICPAVGGGFGLKVQLFVEEAIVPELSRRLGAPVKWVEDRYEALAASGHAKEVICELALATDSDGRFLALEGRYVGDGGAYLAHPWTSLIDPLCAASFLPGLYAVQNVRYTVDTPFTNKCQSTAYRGVGWTAGQAAREALIDDAARELAIDPVELRLRSAIPDGIPYRSATGCNYDGGSFGESMRRAQELLGYEQLRTRQREMRAQGRFLGIGFSPFVEQGAWAGATAAANGFPGFNYLDAVSVAMEPDGTVTLTTGLQANGQGHETTMAQLAADELGVELEDVRVVQGDTAATAYATGSYGSRTAVIGSGAIMRAAGDVREKLLGIAAHLFEAAAADLELANGRISVRGSPEKSFSIREVATAAYVGPRPDDIDPALIATRSYDPPETYSNACIAVVVEVDGETGQVRIERIVAVEDCGTVLNPAVVEGQVIGAIAQAIGATLYEQLPYDENGNFLAGTLADFLYPTAPEVPAIEVDHLETPSPMTEGGFKGMGEGGLIGGPSAIVNAISDALGVPVDRTPLRPCDVLELVAAARSA
jgi:carbon-monoxide dehydrogenase large subunit